MSKKYEYFGKYILLERLATGGMAEVFLARKSGANGVGKFFAIKRILPQYADSPEFIDMFKDEAKIAINLNHSNIVGIHEFGVEKKQFYIVMDFVNGKNLRQILNKIKKNSSYLSIDQIVFMIKEVASGLDHAHRCLDGTNGKPLNITHRDISPQNVMVSYEGELKVVDFGIAKAESKMETTRAGTLKGKFGYMSPEQAEGQQVDLRTDIFSLGIVLWELLANDRLFIANNEINTLKKIRDCQIPSLSKINPNIPSELERITNKALARDRNLRYQTAAALQRDLNRFLNRQYPDFSTRDFSVFVMTLFSDEILQIRKRHIEYAKIPFQGEQTATDSDIDDKTLVEGDTSSFVSAVSLNNETHSQANVNKDDHLPKASMNVFTGSRTDTKTDDSAQLPVEEHKSDLEKGDRKDVLDKVKVKSAMDNRINVEGSAKFYTLEPDENTNTGSFGISSQTRYGPSRFTAANYEPKSRSFTSLIINFVIFLALFLFGYTLAIKFFPGPLAGVIKITDPVLRPIHSFMEVNPNQRSLSSTKAAPKPKKIVAPTSPLDNLPTIEAPKFREIVVSSSPSGAEIYLNEKNTGLITPSRIEVPANEKFNLSVRRAGYAEYNRQNVTLDQIGLKVTAQLKKAVVGYINIDVSPPMNAQIYINNRLLEGQRLPISRYPVPAGKRIAVKAVDPYTRATQTKYVTVPRNKRQNVIFNLNRGTRHPSRFK